MKKTIITQTIDGHQIITGVSEAYIDPIATIRSIQAKGIMLNDANKNELLKEHAIYLNNPKAKLVSEKEAGDIKQKLDNLKENEALTLELKTIPDYRNVKNYSKKDGKWIETIIEQIGVKPTKTELTETEQIEFSEQKEQERLDALSVEDKQKEKESMVDSLASQALQKEGMLRIKGITDYEKQAKDWFDQEKIKVEKKYK